MRSPARATIAIILASMGAWLLLGFPATATGDEPEPSPSPACETCTSTVEPVAAEDPEPPADESSTTDESTAEPVATPADDSPSEVAASEATVASDDAGPASEQGSAGAQRGAVSRASADAAVSIVDNAYQPPSVTVTEGDSVTWTHAGSAPHTVTGDGGLDSGTMSSGETYSHTFNSAGTFSYLCEVHGSSMSGEVVVEAASGGGDGGDTGDGSEDTGTGEGVEPDGIPDEGLPATGTGSNTLALVGALLIVAGVIVWRSSEPRSD